MMTMADITEALKDAGVNVRQEYWNGADKDRKVFVLVPVGFGATVSRPVKSIRVDLKGDVIVEVDE